MGETRPSVIVVGGGISGHTAALKLHESGVAVTVLEAAENVVGGEMSSVEVGGFICNQASTLIPSSYTQITGLMRKLGLGDHLHGPVPAVTSIPRDGAMHRLRVSGLASLADGLTTRLLSLSSKLKLANFAADVAKHGKGIGYDAVAAHLDVESIGDYARRRLNPEIEEYLVGALIRAAYLTEPGDLSVLDLFFAVSKFAGDTFESYSGGIGALNEAIATRVGTRMGCRVLEVRDSGGRVLVTWASDGIEETQEADACIVAVPAHAAARICPDLTDTQRETLANRIRYASIIRASHALVRKSGDPTTMMSFPRSESEGLGVITFDHNYRKDCAPPGRGLISSYWMHDWSTPRLDAECVSDEELEREMAAEIGKFIPGFADDLMFSQIRRWPQATPGSYVGMWKHVDAFRKSLAETARVQFAGDYLNVPGTKAASLSGDSAASRLLTWLKPSADGERLLEMEAQ